MTYNLKLRIGLILTVFGLLIGLYAYRLNELQVVLPKKEGPKAVGTITYDTIVPAARGEILDRNGNVLISNRASYNLILTNYALFNGPSPNESLRKLVNLCRELDIRYTDHLPVTVYYTRISSWSASICQMTGNSMVLRRETGQAA